MAIKEILLHSVEAIEEQYNAGDYIFREGSVPEYYYQIIEGRLKLNSFASDGKEFIQNIFTDGSCFGESMFILGKPYPVNAVALSKCTIVKISRARFFQLLQHHPELFAEIYTALADNAFEKQALTRSIATENIEGRLTEIMDLMKESHANKDKFSLEISYNKQLLASLTGLSVESTAAALQKMEENNVVKIKDKKIFY